MSKILSPLLSCFLLLAIPSMAQTDVDPLIEDLQSDAFAKRVAAKAKVKKMGPDDVAALAKGASHSDPEVSSACQSQLKKLLSDFETSEETRKNLSELESDGATEAKRLLAEIPEPAKPAPANPFNDLLLQNGFGGVELEIQEFDLGEFGLNFDVGGLDGAAGATMMQTTDENGNKLSIQTKGDEITMEYTNDDGEDVKVEAENEDDLKKKDPEAFKLYKSMAGGGIGGGAGGVFQFNFGAPGGLNFDGVEVEELREPKKRKNKKRGSKMTAEEKAIEKKELLNQLEELKKAIEALEE